MSIEHSFEQPSATQQERARRRNLLQVGLMQLRMQGIEDMDKQNEVMMDWISSYGKRFGDAFQAGEFDTLDPKTMTKEDFLALQQQLDRQEN